MVLKGREMVLKEGEEKKTLIVEVMKGKKKKEGGEGRLKSS